MVSDDGSKKYIWPLLVEKAIAKEYGSYANLKGVTIDCAFMMITGNPAFHYDLITEEIRLQIANDSFWYMLVNFVKKGFLVGAKTFNQKTIPEELDNICGRCAYIINDTFELDGYKLIQLHGPNKNSDWSISSEKWATRVKRRIHQHSMRKKIKRSISKDKPLLIFSEENSHFLIPWTEFLKCFEMVFVMTSFDKTWSSTTITDRWTKDNSGGSSVYFNTVSQSPQYLFKINEELEIFCVLIQQVSATERAIHRIGFEIYEYGSKRIGEEKEKPKLIGVGKYSAERAVSLSCVLEQGSYVVLLSTYEPERYGRFTYIVWYPAKNSKGERHRIELKKLITK